MAIFFTISLHSHVVIYCLIPHIAKLYFYYSVISSVPLPTRFVMFILGPKGSEMHLREMGRCMATMMVDEVSYRWNLKEYLILRNPKLRIR